jgi:hypothetical protein
MPLHNVGPRDLPTAEDSAHWRTEREAYIYSPPNKYAPADSPEYSGWGIPLSRSAPTDAIDWVIATFREEELDIYHHDPRDRERYIPIHPKFAWTLALATMAHFAWFKTPVGGQYLNRFFGVQEVEPFFSGYAYLWVDPQNPQSNPTELIPKTLRIFRQWERVADPACPGAFHKKGDRSFIQMTKLFETYRSPLAPDIGSMRSERELEAQHNEEVFDWVSEALQRWLINPKSDDQKPFHRKGRISGPEWVRNQKNSNGSSTYGALDKIVQYHRSAYANKSPGSVRAYRIQAVDRNGTPHGDVRWCAGNEIRVIPRMDYHRSFKRDMDERTIAKTFGCRGCRHTRSCVPHTGRDQLCCHCFGKEIESSTSTQVLGRCTMLPECKACEDRIDNNTGLVNLKQRWNRDVRTGPVPR